MSNLLDRVSRLVSGSVNTLIDSIEGSTPELVMGEALREMDEAISGVRREMGRVEADRHVTMQSLTTNNNQQSDWENKVELALKEGREDLARAGLLEKLNLEKAATDLEATLSDLSDKDEELRGYAASLKKRRNEMQDLLQAQKKASEAAKNSPNSASPPSAPGYVDKAEKASAAFNRISGANATDIPEEQHATDLDELNKLAGATELEARLAAMKARLEPSQ